MGKKGLVRGALFLALFAGLAAAASAQVTVSGGFAVSSMKAEIDFGIYGTESYDGEIGFGGNIYVDYLLPISVPLSLGFELGYDTASVSDGYDEIIGSAVPLLFRAAYHFDLLANLDLYIVGKAGFIVGDIEFLGETEDGFDGFGFGIDIGVAYYFTHRIGAFAEAGFDRYNLEKVIEGTTFKTPFTRFVTAGVSAKF
jgi:hypothetical protein